jgi:hypothetical protein
MPFEKGKQKTGGKVKGSQNKTTKELRDLINQFVLNNIDSIQSDFDQLEPKDKLKFIDRMLNYILPKLSVEPTPIEQVKKNFPPWFNDDDDKVNIPVIEWVK